MFGKVVKWVAAIVGSIIAGLAVWWLTTGADNNSTTSNQPATTRAPQSFMERLTGNYELISWNEAAGPIVLGVGVKDGTLRIDAAGNADWNLGMWDSAASPSEPSGAAPSRTRCGGRVCTQSQQIIWVSGGDRNESIDWQDGLMSIWDDMWLTFCGGHVNGASAPFDLNLNEQSNGRVFLEMSNSEGTFRWVKTS